MHPAMEPRLSHGGNRLDAELLEEQQAVRVGPVLGEHAAVDAQGVGAVGASISLVMGRIVCYNL
jgi:hypothetical protein